MPNGSLPVPGHSCNAPSANRLTTPTPCKMGEFLESRAGCDILGTSSALRAALVRLKLQP